MAHDVHAAADRLSKHKHDHKALVEAAYKEVQDHLRADLPRMDAAATGKDAADIVRKGMAEWDKHKQAIVSKLAS